MNYKFKLIIFVITVLTSCSNHENTWSEKDFVFTVEFSPSFLPTSQIILESTGSSQKIYFKKIHSHNSEPSDTVGYVSENVNSLVACQLNDCFSQDILIKTIEQKNLIQPDLENFKNQLRNVELTTQKNLLKRGILDGITVFLRFKNQTHDNVFAMRCPSPSDSTEYQIITSVLELANRTFENEDSREYFEELKKYF